MLRFDFTRIPSINLILFSTLSIILIAIYINLKCKVLLNGLCLNSVLLNFNLLLLKSLILKKRHPYRQSENLPLKKKSKKLESYRPDHALLFFEILLIMFIFIFYIFLLVFIVSSLRFKLFCS